jgi:DNA-directed RNA polymerase specialized sigma24 family protein
MAPPPSPRVKWVLTQDLFDKLLSFLDADRDQAGLKYEGLRRRLLKFFEWRGWSAGADLADETLNRLAKNIAAGEQIQNLGAYCSGVARIVFLEALRSRNRELNATRPSSESGANVRDEIAERRLECLSRCLGELSEDNRQLFLQYHQGEKSARIEAREQLAKELGIPLNALRIRAHRIRTKLESCVELCVSGLAKR